MYSGLVKPNLKIWNRYLEDKVKQDFKSVLTLENL